MKNIWLFPHRAELECARQLTASLAPDALARIQWELMGPGQKNLKRWLKEFLERPSTITPPLVLIGIAGALDPSLPLGAVVQQTFTRTTLHLSHTPIENPAEAQILFRLHQRPAVVMESLWSDTDTQALLQERNPTRCWVELRGISDHCEGLPLTEIRKRLPKSLDKAVRSALART